MVDNSAAAKWPNLRRALENFLTLKQANPEAWQWRLLVNRLHQGDATILAQLVALSAEVSLLRLSAFFRSCFGAQVKSLQTTLAPQVEDDKKESAASKQMKQLSQIQALLKQLYGENRGAKND